MRHMHDVYARPGESAKFECRITGEQQPEITWSKDYQKLIQGQRFKMTYRDAVASLIIHEVSEKDTGYFTVEASNQHGFATSTAALKVKRMENQHPMYIFY